KSVPIVQKVQSQGLGGIWEEIKEKVGDLKANLFSKISEYLIPTILMAGITWVLSLLNPASAFIRAAKMIIDFVTFIITQGAQIIEFVNSVLDAIIAIAGGGAGGVPALIEKALARSVPVLIGVLAAVMGIGGIANKIKSLFKALSKPIKKAVGWIVDKIVALAKKLWTKLKGKGRGKGGKQAAAPEGSQVYKEELSAGLKTLDGLTDKYKASGATDRQISAETRKVKAAHPIFKELSASRSGDVWQYRYVASPPTTRTGPPTSGSSFSHAPGGLAAHEGHTILTAAKPKTIHLITKHGESVTDAMLKQRLTDALDMFKTVRNDKIQKQQDVINALTRDLTEQQTFAPNPKRLEKIRKLTERIAAAQATITEYRSIDETKRDQVFAALDKWAKSLPHMVSKEVTHFTNNKMMESTIQAALAAKKSVIDAAFTAPDGSSKPTGSQTGVSHPAPAGLGRGFELDPDNLVVPITRPLTTLVLRLVISDDTQRHFMIETAYFE
ncbi:hypothetical protein, partial [Micromonospora sonchi]|uniref:hypothetical protein n=1 Tax=Micromonospora sonchi TaxID=1763543 RepID=UPI001E615C2B